MPPRSRIAKLPEETRSELNRRLQKNSFSGYEALSEWLKEEGYEISRSAVQAYGSAFEQKMGALRLATEQAKAIADAAADNGNAMGEALVMLAQEKAFQVLLDLEINAEDQSFAQLTRSIADLNRAAVQQKKFAQEFRDKLAAKFSELEKETHDNGVEGRTLDPKTLERIRQEIYGIV